ncbi:beta-lactamase family protein [Proteobacteria bacterium 005FR1]|nr:beta-lactamase family protein [Proteobacteria bacterium 005FR1]
MRLPNPRAMILPLMLAASAQLNAEELSFAKPEDVGMSSRALEAIDPLMKGYVESGQLQGIVTMVARKGEVVYFDKYGKLNAESGAPVELDSLFRIYSMTKPVTTVAAMTLYEEGKFQLTDPVSKYLPEFKNTKVMMDGKLVEQKSPLTIQQLMSHTSGLTYGLFGSSEVDKMYQKAGILTEPNLEAFSKNVAAQPLAFQPGDRWNYSVSVDILGRLIEVVSGQPLDKFLKQRIFDPLEMDDTFFQVPADKVNRYGTNHQFDKDGNLQIIGRPEANRYVDVQFVSGGGGLISTADDYMRFSLMMLNGGELHGARILGRKTVDYMTQNHLNGIFTNTDGTGASNGRPGFGFGLGFAVTLDPVLTGTIGSVGEYYWSGVAGTIFWIDPVEELITISMIQQRGSRVPLRENLKAITYGAITD